MPPTQWLKLLQKRMHFGKGSMSVRIEAPVVENPEAISNMQSQKVLKYPENQNGTAPNTERRIHAVATMQYPSLEKIAVLSGFLKHAIPPITSSMQIAGRNAHVSVSL